VDGYFKDKVFLNYLNELMLEAIDSLEELLINEGKIEFEYLDRINKDNFGVPKSSMHIPWLRKAKRQSKFINFDSVYF
tara:strand:+ start:659 stop:892 length:234 start_codon:yes stop_codon:yes gene_type:complete